MRIRRSTRKSASPGSAGWSAGGSTRPSRRSRPPWREVKSKPADVRRSLRACDRDTIDAKLLDQVVEQLGAALPAWALAVSRVIDRLCRLAVARQDPQKGGWDDAALWMLQSLVRDIDAVRKSLKDTETLDDDLVTRA